MTPNPYRDECLIALGHDFGAAGQGKQRAMFPGIREDYGCVEAYEMLAQAVDGLFAALLTEFPAFKCPSTGQPFMDRYHSKEFAIGGVLAYDVAIVILDEFTARPLPYLNEQMAYERGSEAWQRLKATLPAPSLSDALQSILGAD